MESISTGYLVCQVRYVGIWVDSDIKGVGCNLFGGFGCSGDQGQDQNGYCQDQERHPCVLFPAIWPRTSGSSLLGYFPHGKGCYHFKPGISLNSFLSCSRQAGSSRAEINTFSSRMVDWMRSMEIVLVFKKKQGEDQRNKESTKGNSWNKWMDDVCQVG